MAKDRNPYVCKECDRQELRWLGRCPGCGSWNSFEQQTSREPAREGRGSSRRLSASGGQVKSSAPIPMREVSTQRLHRLKVEPDELNGVLGGGLVPGSLVLLGGAPGVGKSTLLTMLAGQLARRGQRVVYLSAEESGGQVRQRAERLGCLEDELYLLEEPCLDQVLPPLYDDPPALLVVDSIQTVHAREVDGIPGSVSQIRYCGGLLSDFARISGSAVALVGHVTKEGELAGPRLLEHLVDTVLYFESDAGGAVRLVRAFKNRFGPTGELAVFEMGAKGLLPVRDASALFLAGRRENEPGSAISAILSGSRPFLVEMQALLASSPYGTPSRVVAGVDSKRVALLAAILERKGNMQLAGMDIFVKVAGGVRVNDPSADMALVAAMASSVGERPLRADLVLIGEVGLAGELRPVAGLESRLSEAQAHGFRKAVVASASPGGKDLPRVPGLEIMGVHTVQAALAAAFGLGKVLPMEEGEGT